MCLCLSAINNKQTNTSIHNTQALVTPGDAARWSALRHALEGQPNPPTFPVDDRVLLMAKQRVALAAKVGRSVMLCAGLCWCLRFLS